MSTNKKIHNSFTGSFANSLFTGRYYPCSVFKSLVAIYSTGCFIGFLTKIARFQPFITPLKTNGWNPKLDGCYRCFGPFSLRFGAFFRFKMAEFSTIYGYVKPPCINYQGPHLEDHPRTCKWLITMVSFRPLRIGQRSPHKRPAWHNPLLHVNLNILNI